MSELSIGVAVIAGFVSFLSPCVLPIIPGFLAYLAGGGGEGETRQRDIFINSVFFVLGFAVIFAILGVLLNSILEAVATDIQVWLARIGGGLIIFFGLYLIGLIKIAFLEREYKPHVNVKFKSRYATSFIFGSAFAVGWTPCVGAVLGGILGLAAAQPGSAFTLLLAYTLGLGVPFLIVGLFTSKVDRFIQKYSYAVKYINIVFGILLVGIGILAFTQNLNILLNVELLNRIIL